MLIISIKNISSRFTSSEQFVYLYVQNDTGDTGHTGGLPYVNINGWNEHNILAALSNRPTPYCYNKIYISRIYNIPI